MYKTHTNLVLDIVSEGEDFFVTVTGDRVKEIMRTRDEAEAKKCYDSLVAHYKQREKDEK